MATVRLVLPGGGAIEVENGDADNVGAILARVKTEFNIGADLQPTVNGRPATAETPIAAGDELALGKPAGQKG